MICIWYVYIYFFVTLIQLILKKKIIKTPIVTYAVITFF